MFFLNWHKMLSSCWKLTKMLLSRWKLEKSPCIPFIKIRVKQRCYPDLQLRHPSDFVCVASSNRIQHSGSGRLQASQQKVPTNRDDI